MMEAAKVPSLCRFLPALGQAIEGGRARAAFDALRYVGIDQDSAWSIIELWAEMREDEERLGVGPESILASFIVAEVKAWQDQPWTDLAKVLGPEIRPEAAWTFPPAGHLLRRA